MLQLVERNACFPSNTRGLHILNVQVKVAAAPGVQLQLPRTAHTMENLAHVTWIRVIQVSPLNDFQSK